MNTRVVHVVAGLDPRHGGPSYSVPRLCQALAGSGTQVDLLSVAEPGTPPGSECSREFPLQRFRWDWANVPIARDLRVSKGLLTALKHKAEKADLIHNHGLWLLPNVYAGNVSQLVAKPLIVTPRGMLAKSALRFSALRKAAFWAALQRPAFARAACFHATSDMEYGDIRDFGIDTPVAVIPNGVDVPATVQPAKRRRELLFIGRLHPKKGLPAILRAWAMLGTEARDWSLRIVGPDESGHGKLLRELAGQLRVSNSVNFQPAAFGEAKTRLYAEASVTVLPSLNENFGITVAESLAAGCPALASTGTPWAGLLEHRCGWWVDNDPVALHAALREIIATPIQELEAMGVRGRAWVERDFSWSAIAAQMELVYGWLRGLNDRPKTVRMD